MNHRVIPIFTLNTVIFPGGKLSLRIYEDRYKRMLKYCASKDSIFGINLIRQGYEVGIPAVPYDVGTIVNFPDHSFSGSEEEIFLEVAAKERFRILKILNDRPYLVAEIADYSDCTKEIIYNQKIEDDFRTQVLEFIKNVVSINGGWIKDPKLPEDFNEFVWYVSSFLQIPNKTKLTILETSNVYQRAELVLDQIKNQQLEIQKILKNHRSQKSN